MRFGFLLRSRRGDACVAPTIVLIVFALLLSCSPAPSSSSPASTDLVSTGRQVYLANCTACHAANPKSDGPIGPAVWGASKELLEARVVHATYPPGYTPKRSSHVMQPLPHLQNQIEALAAYLAP